MIDSLITTDLDDMEKVKAQKLLLSKWFRIALPKGSYYLRAVLNRNYTSTLSLVFRKQIISPKIQG
jgi:hypothetical protein